MQHICKQYYQMLLYVTHVQPCIILCGCIIYLLRYQHGYQENVRARIHYEQSRSQFHPIMHNSYSKTI